MIRLRDLSFRHKIPLRAAALVILTSFVLTASLIYRANQDMRADLINNAESLVRVLAVTLVTPLTHDDVWRAFEIINSPFHQFGSGAVSLLPERILVLDSLQQVYVSTQPGLYPVLTDPAHVDPAIGILMRDLTHRKNDNPIVYEPAESEKIYVAVPIVSESALMGSLVSVYSTHGFKPRFIAIHKNAILITLLVLAGLLPFAWYWGQRMADPLVQLSRAIASVGPSIPDPGKIDLYESRDELGQAGEAFKRMLAELQDKESLLRQVMFSERLAAVGRLSAGIAHEINNPLGGMLNAISTFKKHGIDDPVTAKTLGLLERGLLQIRDTVSALLVEAKPISHALTPEDIEDTHTLVQADARKKHVQLTWDNDVRRELPLPAHLVRQVLLNLLLNASQAAGENGRVHCRVWLHGPSLQIEVGNNGRHIPENEMGYLFEPFSTQSENGHGLGLWVTYQIVQQLGGEIRVESQPGDTRFTISFPIPEQEPSP
jgi:signal transduction histidine kinase